MSRVGIYYERCYILTVWSTTCEHPKFRPLIVVIQFEQHLHHQWSNSLYWACVRIPSMSRVGIYMNAAIFSPCDPQHANIQNSAHSYWWSNVSINISTTSSPIHLIELALESPWWVELEYTMNAALLLLRESQHASIQIPGFDGHQILWGEKLNIVLRYSHYNPWQSTLQSMALFFAARSTNQCAGRIFYNPLHCGR